jgi:hypothetical protein
MDYDFNERLTFSLGSQQVSDHETIKAMLNGCVSVEDSSQLLNVAGVDYIARLRGGAEVLVDAKTRSKCGKFWLNNEPELALEVWSVRPGGKFKTPEQRKKIGWTLCEAKKVDLILFKFNPQDTSQVYLVSFQLLRVAFRQNFHAWMKSYKTDIQSSGSWESECVFVPVGVVYDAIRRASIGTLREANQSQLAMS